MLRREPKQEYDAYRDSETVKELVDSLLIVNRNIQSNVACKDASNEEIAFVDGFSNYMASEIERIAPAFWETIKDDQS